MNRAERIYRIHALLQGKPRSKQYFLQQLEISEATFKRDLAYLRDFMDAPIDYDPVANGYHYDPNAPAFQLPGLWLNESELFGLLASERLLEQIQPGLLSPYIGPLRQRIRQLLSQSGHRAATLNERIQLQPMAHRPTHPERFGTVAAGLLEGQQLRIHYLGREKDQLSQRTIHPQRLLHYRDNWYLAAYCEQAQELRLFSLDRIQQAERLPKPAVSTAPAELDRCLGASFGIFTGSATAWAILRFSPEASRWVADERWHSDQIGQWHGPQFQLQIPYADPRELLRDILKYGPDVEVIAPDELRKMVRERLDAAREHYAREEEEN